MDTASTSQLVEKSKLGPFSFLDQRGIDRLTRGSIDLTSRKKEWGHDSDRLFESFLKITTFQDLVRLASNGLNVYHSVTPDTRKVIKEASQMAAFIPTPHSSAEDKKVWDKFVDYAKRKGFHPLEASEQDVQTWLEQRALDMAAPALVQFELGCLKKWRYQAGKPLGQISSESAISKGLLNFADPSSSAVKGFTSNQLHELLRRVVVH